MRLSSYSNAEYDPGPLWKRACWYVVHALFFINPVNPSSGLKVWWLRRFGARIGTGVVIKPEVRIKYPWFLEISDHSWIGEKVWIDNLTWVRIGANACVSQGAMLLTGNHDYRKDSFDLIVKGIELHDEVWIGARAVVCPGVVVNYQAVLTVQSVATKDLEAYGVYQGNPAVKVRERHGGTV